MIIKFKKENKLTKEQIDFDNDFKAFMNFENDFINSPEFQEEIRLELLNDFYKETLN